MGHIIDSLKFESFGNEGLLKPLIFCHPSQKKLDEATSIEALMTEKLLKKPAKFRNKGVAQCFDATLATLPFDTTIKCIDVLFNPDYKIDVLNMMISAYKRKNFSIIWPGNLKDGKLTYAEEGYRDYKEYNVADYDVTCVIF